MKPKDIITTVANITGISVEEIISKSRLQEICNARFLAAWGIKHIRPDFSFRQLSRSLGRDDHTFAMHALNRAEELYEGCPVFRRMRGDLQRRIGLEVAA
jgi:chromosomal replication initiation ATPase DnaA